MQHLFDVSMGLESQVVGDIQITNQVKQAYQWAADNETAGPFLHRLMHTIFFTNKRVVQETSFRDGAASTSYATVELIEELTADIAEPSYPGSWLGRDWRRCVPQPERQRLHERKDHQPHPGKSKATCRRVRHGGAAV